MFVCTASVCMFANLLSHTHVQLPTEKIDIHTQLPPSHPHLPPTSTPQPYLTSTPTSLATPVQIQQMEEAIKMGSARNFSPVIPQQTAQQMLSPRTFPPAMSQHLPPVSTNLMNANAPFSNLRAALQLADGQSSPASHYQQTYAMLPYSGTQTMYTTVSAPLVTGGDGNVCSSPLVPQGTLTPEHFQQPVQMLNSIQQGLPISGFGQQGMQIGAAGGGSGIVPRLPPSAHDFMSPSGTKLDISSSGKKRRTSSTSGPSLDDQGKPKVISARVVVFFGEER